MTIACSCCTTRCRPFGRGVVLGRHDVAYVRCPACGFVRTEPPTWLDEAYRDPIGTLDVGLLSRCVRLAGVTEAVVRATGGRGRYLDWAGGYGTLTRLLRDRGLDFHHYDAYTENRFAAGLEADPDDDWDLVTCYEVLEHLTDPHAQLARLATRTDVLLATTELLPEPAPAPGRWWYYAPEGGQHIAFYTPDALRALASRLGLRVVSDGRRLHALYRPGALPVAARLLVRRSRLAPLAAPVLRRLRPTPSRLEADARTAAAALAASRPDR